MNWRDYWPAVKQELTSTLAFFVVGVVLAIVALLWWGWA